MQWNAKMHSVVGLLQCSFLGIYLCIQYSVINWQKRNASYFTRLRSIFLNVNHLPHCVCLFLCVCGRKVCLSICMWTVLLRFEAFSLIVLTTDLKCVCELLVCAVWMNISESRPHLHKSMQVSLFRALVWQR